MGNTETHCDGRVEHQSWGSVSAAFLSQRNENGAVCGFTPISQIELLCFTFKGHLFWFKSYLYFWLYLVLVTSNLSRYVHVWRTLVKQFFGGFFSAP